MYRTLCNPLLGVGCSRAGGRKSIRSAPRIFSCLRLSAAGVGAMIVWHCTCARWAGGRSEPSSWHWRLGWQPGCTLVVLAFLRNCKC